MCLGVSLDDAASITLSESVSRGAERWPLRKAMNQVEHVD